MAFDLKKIFDSTMDGIESATKEAIKSFGDDSEAIAKSALTSVNITKDAAVKVIKGQLDVEGAENVARRGIEQLEGLAYAEGNLAAASSAQYLKSIANILMGLAGGLKLP